MCDDWMNKCLVIYIERKVFTTIDNEDIIIHFQASMKWKLCYKEIYLEFIVVVSLTLHVLFQLHD